MPQTGPKTPEGKAKSSRNALKHGLTSEHMYVLGNEPPKDWDLVLQYWTDKLQPRDHAELMIVEDIAHAQWKIRRARTIETGMLDMQMEDQAAYMAETYVEPIDEGGRLAYAFKTLADDSRGLDNIHRYETRARRAFKAGMNALEQLRRMTPAETAEPLPVPEPEPEPIPEPAAAEPQPKPEPTPRPRLAPPPDLPPHLVAQWERLTREIPGFDPKRHAHHMTASLRGWWQRQAA